MPLVKASLEAGILAAYKKAAKLDNKGDDPEKAIKQIAADIATSIDTYIRAATVVTPTGPGTIT